MRYDGLIKALERAGARYEAEVQRVLHKFAKRDNATADSLLASLPGKVAKAKSYKGTHWTQRPENKARLQQQLKRAAKAKAKAKAATNGEA